MSDDLYGRAALEANMGFAPAETTPKEPEEAPIESDHESLRNFIEEAESTDKPIVSVDYRQVGGEHDGEPIPDNQTLKIEDAARNLAQWREREAQEAGFEEA